MENVSPDSIQLIHKGQPVNGSDVPKMLDLQSMEILEVCRVPGVDTTPPPPPKSASPAANHMSVEEKSGTTTTTIVAHWYDASALVCGQNNAGLFDMFD